MNGRAGFFSLALVAATASQAQIVRGTVQDAVTRQPVSGATIRVASDSLAWRATTDSLGAFSVRLTRPGLYTVEATRIGYRQQGDTVRVEDGETVALRMELAENAVTLHPVVVVARYPRLPEGFEQRRAMGFGRFLDPTDIENRHASRTTDLFRGLPGVHLTPLSRGAGMILQFRKFAGFCQPMMWVDGLPMGETRQSLDVLMEFTAIQAIEVYQSVSTAPVQYRSGDCGVVLFWMKHTREEQRSKPKHWKIALGAAAALGLGLVFALR
jgi:hypothetical protein